MNRIFLFAIIQETIGWLITVAIAIATLCPVTQKINYNFLFENGLFIAAAGTYLRYFLFYNSIPFLQPNWVRFVVFTANLVLWVYMLNRYEMMLQIHDDYVLEEFGSMIMPLNNDEQKSLLDYLYKLISFSGFVALLATALFNLRLIGAYWRVAKVRFSQRMQE